MEESPNPYSTPVADPEKPVNSNCLLSELKDAEVKKLRNHSQTIHAAGVFAILAMLLMAGTLYFINEDYYLTILGQNIGVKKYSIIIIILSSIGAYALLARPSWGKVVAIIYCSLLIINLNILTTIIGILCIISLSTSKRLFGPGKIPHQLIEEEYELRKRAKTSK